jgi:hypothetical protein
MKAWEDLENDEDVTICHTLKSRWYLNYGVKIEMLNDGTIEIKNTMINSDHYEEVSSSQYAIFRDKGWLYGCYSLNIDMLDDDLYNINRLIDRLDSSDNINRFVNKKNKIIEKLASYENKLSKLSPSL